ncbi:hypothetical protein [Cerasicoccus fimbriatus]|uniref:hypothetical protein n=1 Tax=Cerasicoccus fimbriatus TaxID=3014554 RepID=UPI0022B475EA|nr:hypothetical protein [Cerasicoccus sp. TK19100]
MRALQFCVFVIAYLVAGTASGQLDGFYVEKRQIFYQDQTSGISMPKHGAFLDYYFSRTGNTDILQASFSANFSNVPIQFRDTGQYRGFVAFEDVNALEAVYKDIFYYEFTTQLLGELPKNANVRFTSTGWYSGANPRVSNFAQLSTINAPFNFNLSLTQSAIGSAGVGWQNYIQLTVIDPVALSGVHVSQYAGTSNTLQIPGGTLGNSREYVARIQFISPDTWSEVGTFNDYRVVSQYSNETWVKLRTLGSYPDFLAELTRYYHWKQTSPSPSEPLADKDYLLARIPTAQNPNVAAASLLQLDVRKGYALEKLPDDKNDETLFAYELRDEELDNFVSGLLSVGLRYSAGNTRAEMVNWDLNPATNTPLITNWEAAQAIAPDLDFALMVNVPNNMVGTSLATTLTFYDQDGAVVTTIEETHATASSIAVEIPATALAENTQYDATLTLTASNGVTNGIDLQVAHVVDFSVETSLSNWLGVASAAIYRGTYFANGNTDTPDVLSSVRVRLTQDSADSLTAASVLEGETVKTTLTPQASDPLLMQSLLFYADEPTALSDFPYETYLFQTTIDNLSQSVPYDFALQAEAAPVITVETSHLLNSLDPSLPIPLSWTGIDASADNVSIEVVNSADPQTPIALENIAPDGLSGEIPANTFAVNSSYSLMIFFRRDLQNNYDDALQATLIHGDEYFTFIPVTTGIASYAGWLSLYLDAGQLADPAYTALTANPDGDTLTNLQEYAFNGHPLAPTTPPQVQADGGLYKLKFQFRSDNPLLSYQAEQSTTLDPPFAPFNGNTQVTAGSPYQTVQLTFVSAERLFVRLITRFGQTAE